MRKERTVNGRKEILQSSSGWLIGQHSGPVSWGKTFGIHPKQQKHSQRPCRCQEKQKRWLGAASNSHWKLFQVTADHQREPIWCLQQTDSELKTKYKW